jgi:imidazolonepropionase-like amidohydrolase
MKRALFVLVFALVGAHGALAASSLVIAGGTVHPVSGPEIPGGMVLVENGKITAVGANVSVPAGAERVDATGLHVYPGMIAANTILGLQEIGEVRATRDVNEVGNINPNARAKVSLNADSELIPVARANGILTALSATAGGTITGTSVVWKLDGWNWEEMTIKEPAALHVHWPSMITHNRGWWDEGPVKSEEEQKKEREKQLKEVRDAFDNAKAYMKAREAMQAGGARHDFDVRWEAMIPALKKQIPVFVNADEYLQIESALNFAKDEGLNIVIVGGRDAWRLADRLAAARVPVIYEETLSMPRRTWEPYDAAYTVPQKLQAAGVPFCISTGAGDASNLRNLPYEAAMAAAFGLPKEEALKAVTLYPAQILGVADRLGSIEPGKDATLIVTDGDPLEIESHVKMAWISGDPVDLSSRHTRLYDKYRNRPRTDGGVSKLAAAP